MKRWKAVVSLILGAVMVLSLSACTIPMPGYADYDVSAYIKALLDSSYRGEHDDLMEIASMTREEAEQYNTTTVENASVIFCNTYGIAPSEEQLQELNIIMRQAYLLGKYTVKNERRVDSGYYLEVEVAAITNFAGRGADIERMKEEAVQEATAINNAQSLYFTQGEDEGDEDSDESSDGDEEGSSGEEADESSAAPTTAPDGSGQKADANDLFVEKVLEFCKQELANISYDPETRTIALDIRQTDEGELQLDLNQIEKIDRTVVRFE